VAKKIVKLALPRTSPSPVTVEPDRQLRAA
jgi:hypothetical protein